MVECKRIVFGNVGIIPPKIAFLKGTDRCFSHVATESYPAQVET